MQKHRAEVRNLNKQIVQTAQQREQLEEEGRFHDLTILDLKVRLDTAFIDILGIVAVHTHELLLPIAEKNVLVWRE